MNIYKFNKVLDEMSDRDVVELGQIAFGEHNNYENWQIITPSFSDYCSLVYSDDDLKPEFIASLVYGKDTKNAEVFRMANNGVLECTTYKALADEVKEDPYTLSNACESFTGSDYRRVDSDLVDAINEEDPIKILQNLHMSLNGPDRFSMDRITADENVCKVVLYNDDAKLEVQVDVNPKENNEISKLELLYKLFSEKDEKVGDLFDDPDAISEFIIDTKNGEFKKYQLDWLRLKVLAGDIILQGPGDGGGAGGAGARFLERAENNKDKGGREL